MLTLFEVIRALSFKHHSFEKAFPCDNYDIYGAACFILTVIRKTAASEQEQKLPRARKTKDTQSIVAYLFNNKIEQHPHKLSSK